MYIFTRGKDTFCANCKRNPDMVVNGAVDLTLSMQRLNVLSNRRTLRGDRVTLVAVGQDGTGIDLDQIGLELADIYKIDIEGEGYKYTFVNHVEIPDITLPRS
jgi:hypothetical protein